jgi:hypothetical protein
MVSELPQFLRPWPKNLNVTNAFWNLTSRVTLGKTSGVLSTASLHLRATLV